MSRAYRVRVRESLDRTLRAEDCVSTQLEIIEVLPPEQMAGLLAAELEARGYRREGNVLVRKEEGVVITVDAGTGRVTVKAEACEKVRVEAEQEGRAYDDTGASGKAVREQLLKNVQSDLEHRAKEKEAELQGKVTSELEGQLIDLRQELDGAVNRATAEALKIKAAQLGRIKEIAEDKAAGSLTIVVEV